MPNDEGELYPHESHLEGLHREREGYRIRIAGLRPEQEAEIAALQARLDQVEEQIKSYGKGDPSTTAAKRGGSRTTAQRSE